MRARAGPRGGGATRGTDKHADAGKETVRRTRREVMRDMNTRSAYDLDLPARPVVHRTVYEPGPTPWPSETAAGRGRVALARTLGAGLGLLFALALVAGATHAARGDDTGEFRYDAFRYSTSGDGRGHWIGVLPEWSRATRSGRPVVERRAPLRGIDLHHDPIPTLHIECRAPPPRGTEAHGDDPGAPFGAYVTARKWRQDRPARLAGDPAQWTSLAIDWVFGGIEPAFEERAQARVWAPDSAFERTDLTTVRRLAYDWSAETRYVAVLDGAAVHAGLEALRASGERVLAVAIEGETIKLAARYAFPPDALARTLGAADACGMAPHSK